MQRSSTRISAGIAGVLWKTLDKEVPTGVRHFVKQRKDFVAVGILAYPPCAQRLSLSLLLYRLADIHHVSLRAKERNQVPSRTCYVHMSYLWTTCAKSEPPPLIEGRRGAIDIHPSRVTVRHIAYTVANGMVASVDYRVLATQSIMPGNIYSREVFMKLYLVTSLIFRND